MKRRDFLTLLPLAAGAISWGCRRKLQPKLIKIDDFEDRKGGWRVIKVACVGDSITHGAGVEDREKNNYPKQLGDLLGNRFEVRNFGRSGATLAPARAKACAVASPKPDPPPVTNAANPVISMPAPQSPVQPVPQRPFAQTTKRQAQPVLRPSLKPLPATHDPSAAARPPASCRENGCIAPRPLPTRLPKG